MTNEVPQRPTIGKIRTVGGGLSQQSLSLLPQALLPTPQAAGLAVRVLCSPAPFMPGGGPVNKLTTSRASCVSQSSKVETGKCQLGYTGFFANEGMKELRRENM